MNILKENELGFVRREIYVGHFREFTEKPFICEF